MSWIPDLFIQRGIKSLSSKHRSSVCIISGKLARGLMRTSKPSYFGGKRKLVKYIFKPIKKTEGIFIDAFLGTKDLLSMGARLP